MTRFASSIRARLTLFIFALVAIVVGVAVSGVLGLRFVDVKTQELDQKWLAGTAILGEMGDLVAEYRIAEGYRVLAAEPKQRAEAEVLADEHRRDIQQLQNEYVALLGSQIQKADLDSFRSAWSAYCAAHDAWVRSDVAGTVGDPVRFDRSLQPLYNATDVAVDRLIAANISAAHAQAVAVDYLTDGSIVIGAVVSASAILLAIWLVFRIRSQIIEPLGAITRALSKLAAGSREIRVPELDRADEIGAMAKAFEIFRTNALALEQAHEATRVAQDKLHSLARHDALTGLPNRRVFSAELQAVLSRARSGTAPYSVLLVGLDQFKRVNDLKGHPIGDLVLCEVARHLEEIVGNDGMVARLGGDEFAIIAMGDAEQQTHLDHARELASRVLGAVRKAILVGEITVEIGASIGIAPCRTDSNDEDWPEDIRLAVNVSPSELKDPLLPSRLLAILAQEDFAPSRLEVEITETALVSDIETTKAILTTLQSVGVKVSLDDFGTGYSSLYHLRELKFDKVKIDRSFVQLMRHNPESEKIVDAILGPTKNLNMPAVAEGIEDPAVLLRLAAKGCEFDQGYCFGKAVPADSATDMLRRRGIAQARIIEAHMAA